MRFYWIALLVFTFHLIGCRPYARLTNQLPNNKLHPVEYQQNTELLNFTFLYSDPERTSYLQEFANKYQLDALVADHSNDLDKIKALLHWTHQQWKHNGSNRPTKSDAISIVEEAKTGKQFRCVEYGFVSAAALNSVGLPARTLGLKTQDVEVVKYGAGHVAAEVYSPTLKKWIFVDGQFDVIPMLNDTPLNAAELYQAIQTKSPGLKLVRMGEPIPAKEQKAYLEFVGKYLFYLDVKFDNRYGSAADPKFTYQNKTIAMLVPLHAKQPTIFQRSGTIEAVYTNSLGDFYQAPRF